MHASSKVEEEYLFDILASILPLLPPFSSSLPSMIPTLPLTLHHSGALVMTFSFSFSFSFSFPTRDVWISPHMHMHKKPRGGEKILDAWSYVDMHKNQVWFSIWLFRCLSRYGTKSKNFELNKKLLWLLWWSDGLLKLISSKKIFYGISKIFLWYFIFG